VEGRAMSDREVYVVMEQMAFPECPRWHDGKLWVSDQHDRRILTMTESAEVEIPLEVPNQPSGLGWLPDGRMLIVSMLDRKLLRWDPEGLVEVADLSAWATWHTNDMVVHPTTGHAYVGNFGFDLEADAPPATASLVCVAPDGDAWPVVDSLCFPNGSVITNDGSTLIVAETYAQRLTAYDLQPDGSVQNPRVWADLQPYVPDGICLDAQGAVWFADPLTKGVGRVFEGQAPSDWIPTGESGAYAVALGGSQGTSLYICTAKSFRSAETVVQREGRVQLTYVDVPGAAWA
jgi:sugar lactone lactonase YvrE